MTANTALAEAKPSAEQTPRRRKITKRWERQFGLTASQIAKAQAAIDELQDNPLIKRIGWEEVLGSNEWKYRKWTSLTTRKLSCVEIVIGEAIVE